MRLEITPVTPLSVDQQHALVHSKGTCTVQAIAVERYPQELIDAGKALRDHRVMNTRLTIGDAAKILEISVSEYSGLEHGRFTADMAEVRRRLDDGRAKGR